MPKKKILKIVINYKKEINKVKNKYPFKTTEYYEKLINKYDKEDPIYRQSYPDIEEINSKFSKDPFNEEKLQSVKYLIHRYPNRAVLLANNFCAMNCRHCMRKRIWKNKNYIIDEDKIDEIVKYSNKNQIEDIIISGGDPLLIPPKKLKLIIRKLNKIKSLKIIRIGSRLPVVDPDRINKNYINIFKKYDNLYFLTHFNHFRELTQKSINKIKKIKKTATPLFNQTVLLRGVNDCSKILKKLFNKLLSIGVKPYYLHQCDLVEGATHFWVDIKKGIEILKKLQGNISGLSLPYYAVDLPDANGKVLLGPNYKPKKTEEGYIFRNYQNKKIMYKVKDLI